MAINFFNEDVNFKLKNKRILKDWLILIISSENYKIRDLNYIFCSDNYLHQINLEHLNHDTFTDIITFDNSERANEVEGDIFISVERVKENAQLNKVGFQTELNRVLAHGIYHLMGYKDKTKKDATLMREAEDRAIELFNVIGVPRETSY